MVWAPGSNGPDVFDVKDLDKYLKHIGKTRKDLKPSPGDPGAFELDAEETFVMVDYPPEKIGDQLLKFWLGFDEPPEEFYVEDDSQCGARAETEPGGPNSKKYSSKAQWKQASMDILQRCLKNNPSNF